MEIRKALTRDAIQIHALINNYARQEQMLPRTLLSIYENIRDFHVAVVSDGAGERVLGCSALHFTWGDMAEVRSLAVYESSGRRGVGRSLVEANIAEAREHGLVQVYAFTYVVEFFARLGFRVVAHESMPRKVWMDCVNCHKFNCCDEVAMVLDLVEGANPEPFDVSQVNVPIVRIDAPARRRP
jgi:amino-acid N-acetyltransferase